MWCARSQPHVISLLSTVNLPIQGIPSAVTITGYFPSIFPAPEPLPPTLLAPIHIPIAEPDPYDPVPILVLPHPMPLSSDPYDPLSLQHNPPTHSLPADTGYGMVQSGPALICAREYPWIHVARTEI
ncbi:hypothetical protein B0H10DRAFT_1950192 [Mycena sp. CBHHK59/15]|nr:hypothetical protein B0H10DRAFT_1950192 [Mycena sp. CBHHK59/15]